MKTRNGFISNSSSTSFIIYGWAFDRDQAKTTAIELFDNIKATVPSLNVILRRHEDLWYVGISGWCTIEEHQYPAYNGDAVHFHRPSKTDEDKLDKVAEGYKSLGKPRIYSGTYYDG